MNEQPNTIAHSFLCLCGLDEFIVLCIMDTLYAACNSQVIPM